MRILSSVLAFAALSWMVPIAALPLPRPLEDVTKLEKPTICFDGISGWGLYLIDWDGQNRRLWMDEKTRFSGPPSWSLDGKKAAIVVFTEEDWAYTTYILDLVTGGVTNMTQFFPDGHQLTNPRWSPDGKWLVYLGYGPNTPTHDLFKLNVATKRLVNITNSPEFSDSQASWSPDGAMLAFDSVRSDPNPDNWETNLYIMDADGSNKIQLTDDHPIENASPVWSPDGKTLAFLSYNRTSPGSYDLYTIHPDGSNIERITFDEKEKGSPQWSADGKWLLYGTRLQRGEPYEIFRVHVETKEAVHVTNGTGGAYPEHVLAGRSRFLSVDPGVKKKESWGALKKTMESETRKP